MSLNQVDQIQQRAYQIWLDAGCPEGQQEAHWLQARGEIEEAEADEEQPAAESQAISELTNDEPVPRPKAQK